MFWEVTALLNRDATSQEKAILFEYLSENLKIIYNWMNVRDKVKHEFLPLKNENSYLGLYGHQNSTVQY